MRDFFFHLHQMEIKQFVPFYGSWSHSDFKDNDQYCFLQTSIETRKEKKDGGATTSQHGVLVQIRKGSLFLKTLHRHLPENLL